MFANITGPLLQDNSTPPDAEVVYLFLYYLLYKNLDSKYSGISWIYSKEYSFKTGEFNSKYNETGMFSGRIWSKR